MTLLTITISYLKARWSNTLLNMLLIAIGVTLITALLLFTHQLKERFYRDGAGIDLVVGAKGSPLQLILSSVQHIDVATGNIQLSEAKRIMRHPHIKQAIPISLGDAYKGFRIVGSETSYLMHFNTEFQQGEGWTNSMQVVLGASVAKTTGMKLGDRFVGVHGLMPDGHAHDDHPYTVVGVLKPTGSVIDRLIVTSLDSVWDVHSEHADEKDKHVHDDDHDHHHHDHAEHDSHATEKEITALLITYRNRAAAFSFPRTINQTTSMQAASPAFEMARLIELVGVGTSALFYFSLILISIALIGVFIGLINTIQERVYDLAVFRTLGAPRKTIVKLIIMEGMIIAFVGSVLGLLIGHLAVECVGIFAEKANEMGISGFIMLPDVWIMWAIVMLSSLCACFLPAWKAYKVDIYNTLMRGK